MLRQLKRIYLTAVFGLLLTAFATAFAQADRIVVGGKKPLKASHVEAVVRFYEWAFETSFTAAERSRFEAMAAEYHTQDPERSAAENDTILKALAAVESKDAAKQAAMRESFTAGFVADLKKLDNASSQFFLPIYERSRAHSTTADSVVIPAKKGRVGGEIVGRWVRHGGAGGMRDYTGKTQYNDSDDVTFVFGADGDMRFLNEKRTLSITQCRMSETIDLPGRYTVGSGTVTIQFAAGKHVSTSTCDPKRNFSNTVPGDTVSKRFVIRSLDSVFRPDAPLILCMDGAADDRCFEKVK